MAEPLLTGVPPNGSGASGTRGGGGFVVPASLADFAGPARAALPPEVWDFVDGGSGTETTVTANRAALDRVAVLPRVLTGVDRPRTDAPLLGRPQAMPVAVAPMAYQKLVHPDGEPALAAAARAAGVPYVASTLSSTRIEEIAAVGGEVWFQLYWLRDRGMVAELLDRAHAAGCAALMVTVDVPILGRRLRDVRNGFALPPHVTAANLPGGRDDLAHQGTPGVSAVAVHTGAVFAPALSWPTWPGCAVVPRCPCWSRASSTPATRRARSTPGRTRSWSPTTVAGSSTARRPPRRRCPRWSPRWASGARCCWTAASAAAWTCCGRWPSARPACWSAARCSGRSRRVAGPAPRRALALLAAELSDALTLTGCADPAAARHLRTTTGG